ncbi:MAG: helix-turn-helix transcriptional regulator [Spirochaetales bacterium]|nr:helix-turn-helix transcriptional regulator [Spirochaetales bacterium]
MQPSWRSIAPLPRYEHLAERYRGETHFGLAVFADSACALDRCAYYPWAQAAQRGLDVDRMVSESVRWGEPTIALDNDGLYVWCVPICLNAEAVGGLFSAAKPALGDETNGAVVGQAAWTLLELASELNICNASLMKLHREQGRTHAYKAEAIHTAKRNLYQGSREIYLQEEFGLLSAIHRGDKQRARAIINRILIRIYGLEREDLEVLKTLVLEMVVLMYRTAVDKGADPRDLLGVNSSYLKDFHEIKTDIELSHWLTRWLEDFISTSLTQIAPVPPDSIALAIEYMKNNLDHPLSRDEVARACSMSYGYFSKVFHQRTGHTFTQLLNRFRFERACTILEETGLNISQIALECGFSDQSYFSKVFRRYAGISPKDYRRRQTGRPASNHR